MTHVPDDLVARRFERGAEGDGQLDDTQPRADVAARLRDDVDEPLPHFVGELLQLIRWQIADVGWTVNRFKYRHGSPVIADFGLRIADLTLALSIRNPKFTIRNQFGLVTM
jgi:hypothetical protein